MGHYYGFPLIENILKLLAKIVLMLLELTAIASATDATIQKKLFGSEMTTLTISNEETKDIMKVIKYLGESGLLNKSVSKEIENAITEQKGRFLGRQMC